MSPRRRLLGLAAWCVAVAGLSACPSKDDAWVKSCKKERALLVSTDGGTTGAERTFSHHVPTDEVGSWRLRYWGFLIPLPQDTYEVMPYAEEGKARVNLVGKRFRVVVTPPLSAEQEWAELDPAAKAQLEQGFGRVPSWSEAVTMGLQHTPDRIGCEAEQRGEELPLLSALKLKTSLSIERAHLDAFGAKELVLVQQVAQHRKVELRVPLPGATLVVLYFTEEQDLADAWAGSMSLTRCAQSCEAQGPAWVGALSDALERASVPSAWERLERALVEAKASERSLAQVRTLAQAKK